MDPATDHRKHALSKNRLEQSESSLWLNYSKLSKNSIDILENSKDLRIGGDFEFTKKLAKKTTSDAQKYTSPLEYQSFQAPPSLSPAPITFYFKLLRLSNFFSSYIISTVNVAINRAAIDMSADDAANKGAKRRSGIPTPRTTSRLPPHEPAEAPAACVAETEVGSANAAAAAAAAAGKPGLQRLREDGRDSGLSSESTTPVNGSPPPRQQQVQQHLVTHIPRRTRMLDIIAASKARLMESEKSLALSNNRSSRLLHSRSSTDSPRSLDGRKPQVFSPLKPPRSIQSPGLDSGDESSLRLERGNYNHMLQDIVSIKTMLLQLKRVLQETDTLNPFDNVMKNGLLYNLKDGNATQDGSQSDAEELADLRRQVVFLQGQVDEKERTIQSLQTQLTRYQNSSGAIEKTSNGDSKETSNAATQTDKLRPVSTGPSAVQSLSQDNGSHIASFRIGKVECANLCDLVLGYLLLYALNALIYLHLFMEYFRTIFPAFRSFP